MTNALKYLEPKAVWHHFENLNAIPRASTKEAAITKFMVEFGKSLDLDTKTDAIGNVIIKKPASKGRENRKTVVLQGHLDMVHQKTAESNFEFTTQGIEMRIDGDWVKAKETTLGADNGIGVAAIMAVLSSDDLAHPPIEALFTVDEEVGMTGAMALNSNELTGEILLNLDSEDDDEITIGCAGGVDIKINGSYLTETLDASYHYYKITLGGLTGGHSGVEIHLNLANAVKVLAACLQKLGDKVTIRISDFNGGGLTNVIPRDCTAIIAVKSDAETDFKLEVKKIEKEFKEAFKNTDASLELMAEKVAFTSKVMQPEAQKSLLASIASIPNGVQKMTEGMPDLVQTSNNLASIRLAEGSYAMACHARSSVDVERDALVTQVQTYFSDAEVIAEGPYPGWEPRPNSEILKIAKECYQELHGEYPKVASIHAGLECGVLSGTYPKMEMISFGPNVRGAHSPDERLQISSTQKFWKYLIKILQEIP